MSHVPKILFIGPGRSGKDTAAQFLHRRGNLRYGGSTSWAALPLMAAYFGRHQMEVWDRRHEHRETWKEQCDLIRSQGDQCFLIRCALDTGNMITGVRGLPEINAAIAEKLFDSIVWIDNPRVDADPTMDFGSEKANVVIRNNGSLVKFQHQLIDWAKSKGYINE